MTTFLVIILLISIFNSSCFQFNNNKPIEYKQKIQKDRSKLTPSLTPILNKPPVILQAKIDDIDITKSVPTTSYKSDFIKTFALFTAAMGFAAALSYSKGTASGIEFISGYFLELCLSVDNLIVFILLFDSFKVSKEDQEKVCITLYITITIALLLDNSITIIYLYYKCLLL